MDLFIACQTSQFVDSTTLRIVPYTQQENHRSIHDVTSFAGRAYVMLIGGFMCIRGFKRVVLLVPEEFVGRAIV